MNKIKLLLGVCYILGALDIGFLIGVIGVSLGYKYGFISQPTVLTITIDHPDKPELATDSAGPRH